MSINCLALPEGFFRDARNIAKTSKSPVDDLDKLSTRYTKRATDEVFSTIGFNPSSAQYKALYDAIFALVSNKMHAHPRIFHAANKRENLEREAKERRKRQIKRYDATRARYRKAYDLRMSGMSFKAIGKAFGISIVSGRRLAILGAMEQTGCYIKKFPAGGPPVPRENPDGTPWECDMPERPTEH